MRPCFKPDSDLSAIWAILRGDATLLNLLGLAGADEVTIRQRIVRRSYYDDLAESEKRLCIYFRPSRLGRSQIITAEVLQIDCHVPALDDDTALQVQERVRNLLHGTWVGNRPLWFSGQLGELPSQPGFVCTGSRYTYQATI